MGRRAPQRAFMGELSTEHTVRPPHSGNGFLDCLERLPKCLRQRSDNPCPGRSQASGTPIRRHALPWARSPRTHATHSLVLLAKRVHGDPACGGLPAKKARIFCRFLFPSLLEGRRLRQRSRSPLAQTAPQNRRSAISRVSCGPAPRPGRPPARQQLTRMIRSELVPRASRGGMRVPCRVDPVQPFSCPLPGGELRAGGAITDPKSLKTTPTHGAPNADRCLFPLSLWNW